MEHNIGVGAIVGLVTASSFYIYNSYKFNSLQKTVLLICILFPPAQWLGILIVFAYNSNKENNTVERKTEKKLDSTISNLVELKEKGILTEDEYISKINQIELEKEDNFLKNSKEYNQLKNLLDSDILTKNEFENKIILLKESIKNSTINKENNFVESLNTQTVNRKTTDNQILKIVSKNYETIGDSVFINDKIAPDGIYIYKLYTHKLVVENGKIKELYFIEKYNGIVIEKTNEFSSTKGDKVFLHNGNKAPSGKYKTGFMSSKIIVEDGVFIRYD